MQKRYNVSLQNGLILESHTYVYFQVLNNLINDIIAENLGVPINFNFWYIDYILTRAVLGGGVFTPNPPPVFRKYLKNGSAQRRRFWHTLSYIFSG